ncbi:hypothetical protein [Luteolibacter luteus]|uniref:Uncharacterized protein n=1 Tax=Luteolibacter luteus TaxID=2728835 RepID=A0A858RMX7_9BACT|nr:hypothetical protein [Luteolibacter luteus]QJE98065.1 hypothetical protein HHL09_20505 [Luteolibacter luteus]
MNTNDRQDVVSFYHAVYGASEGYRNRIAWTGNYTSTAAGAEGTVSAAFVTDVERRVNFFRAMSGVRADIRVNSGATVNIQPGDAFQPDPATTKAAAAQRSALMIIRTYPSSAGLSHSPTSANTTAWTPAAWNANKNGNLSLGFFGPGAVDAYLKEDVMGTSSWNLDVGHRRWILFQWSSDFATGDTPGSFNSTANTVRPPSNSLYVVQKTGELDFTRDPVFAAYPGAGFFPASLNSPYWSLSYPSADFSAATVSMTNASSSPVTATVVSRRTGYGDNSIVWQVPAAAAVKAVGPDTRWNVTVSNIQGAGVPSSYSYSVTLIDPNKLQQTPVISGPSALFPAGGNYSLTGVTGADRMEVGFFLKRNSAWTEGAEDAPAPQVIDRTSGTYPLRASNPGYVKSGAKAFRLTFPSRYDPVINGVPEQILELDREILVGSGGQLNFSFRRGLMTAASKLVAEYSSDSGSTWIALADPYSGLGGTGDSVFQSASLALPANSEPIRIRFRYYLADPQSALYSHEDYPSQATGVFIDDISTTASHWLERTALASGAGLSSFRFDSTTAGATLAVGQEWFLRSRAVLGGKAFSYGPSKKVGLSGPLQLSGPVEPPVTGAAYGFVTDPAAESYRFEVTRLGSSDWKEGAEGSPLPQIIPGNATTYALYSNLSGYRSSGALSFRLALSSATDEEDSFTVDRNILPAAASALEFWMRRGAMSPTNRLHAEVSTDGGITWTSIWSLPGVTKPDKKGVKQSLSLAAYADKSIRVRFVIRKAAGGTTLKWNAKTSGVWLDEIAVTSSSTALSSKESTVSGASAAVILNSATAGHVLQAGSSLRLRLRSVSGASLGNWGPALIVSPSATAPSLPVTFDAWSALEYPGHALGFEGDLDRDGMADGFEYAFSLNPILAKAETDSLSLSTGKLMISRDLPVQRADIRYGAEWSDDLSTWSTAGVEIRIEGGKISASVAKAEGNRYLRWKIQGL